MEPPGLLADLLEESAQLFHNRCAILHRVFHAEWHKRLAEAVGREQIEHPDDPPAEVEARAARRLAAVRKALRDGRREMLREQERERAARDEAIRAYVGEEKGRAA